MRRRRCTRLEASCNVFGISRKRVRQIEFKTFDKITNFCCLKARLIVEVDGGQHEASSRDRERDAFLTRSGYRVLRSWNNEVMGNVAGVVETLARSLRGERELD